MRLLLSSWSERAGCASARRSQPLAPLRREEGLPGVQMRSLRLSSWTSSAPQLVSLLGEFYLHGAAGRSGRPVWGLSQQSPPYHVPVGSPEAPLHPTLRPPPPPLQQTPTPPPP